MPELVAVVIRKLPQHRPVTSAVITEPESKNDIDDMEHYLVCMAQDHIRRFINQFVEFKRAEWYVDIINLSTNETVSATQIDCLKL